MERRGGWLVAANATRAAAPRVLKHFPVKPLSAVAFSPDGLLLATGSGTIQDKNPGDVWIWETATGNSQLRFTDLPAPVSRLAFTANGAQLLIAVGSEVVGRGDLLSLDVKSNSVVWRVK